MKLKSLVQSYYGPRRHGVAFYSIDLMQMLEQLDDHDDTWGRKWLGQVQFKLSWE